MNYKSHFSKKEMLNQLAYYERKENELIDNLYEVLGDEVDSLLDKINILYEQLFIDTATWGLDIWESNLNIENSGKLSFEERRAIIKSKLRSKGKVSTDTIEEIVNDFTGYASNVYFNGKIIIEINNVRDVVLNDSLYNTIKNTKPAHLGMDISIVNEHKIVINFTTYEFPVDLRITEMFTVENEIFGLVFSLLGQFESKTYSFGVEYGITDVMMTETMTDSNSMTKIVVENATPHNTVKFIRPGTKQVGEGEI